MDTSNNTYDQSTKSLSLMIDDSTHLMIETSLDHDHEKAHKPAMKKKQWSSWLILFGLTLIILIIVIYCQHNNGYNIINQIRKLSMYATQQGHQTTHVQQQGFMQFQIQQQYFQPQYGHDTYDFQRGTQFQQMTDANYQVVHNGLLYYDGFGYESFYAPRQHINPQAAKHGFHYQTSNYHQHYDPYRANDKQLTTYYQHTYTNDAAKSKHFSMLTKSEYNSIDHSLLRKIGEGSFGIVQRLYWNNEYFIKKTVKGLPGDTQSIERYISYLQEYAINRYLLVAGQKKIIYFSLTSRLLYFPDTGLGDTLKNEYVMWFTQVSGKNFNDFVDGYLPQIQNPATAHQASNQLGRALLEIGQRAKQVLSYFHQVNVFHYDVNGGNLMINSDQGYMDVKVIDWGKSKVYPVLNFWGYINQCHFRNDFFHYSHYGATPININHMVMERIYDFHTISSYPSPLTHFLLTKGRHQYNDPYNPAMEEALRLEDIWGIGGIITTQLSIICKASNMNFHSNCHQFVMMRLRWDEKRQSQQRELINIYFPEWRQEFASGSRPSHIQYDSNNIFQFIKYGLLYPVMQKLTETEDGIRYLYSLCGNLC